MSPAGAAIFGPTAALPALAAVLAASLLGSLHCAGMCGGLVLFAVGSDGRLERRAGLHAAYHAGRGLSYTALGLAAGWVGGAADLSAGLAAGVRPSAALAGAAMVVIGLAALARNLGLVRWRMAPPGPLRRAAEAAHRAALALPPLHRAAAVGALTPMLPCGWLYAFVIVAGGSGGPWLGAAVMATFWAGTLPVMGLLGAGLQALTGPLRARVPVISGLLVIGLGLMAVMGRVGLPAPQFQGLDAGPLSARVRAVGTITHDDLTCCAPGAAASVAGGTGGAAPTLEGRAP